MRSDALRQAFPVEPIDGRYDGKKCGWAADEESPHEDRVGETGAQPPMVNLTQTTPS
jgi:hypothetical protein